jgi:intracellular septation protein A
VAPPPDPGPLTRSGFGQAVAEQFSVQAAVGGVRGMIESVLPVTVFTTAYAVTHAITTALVVAVGVSVVLLLARLLARQAPTQAISGLAGVLIGGGIAWWTGNAADFFLLPLLKNLFFVVVYAGSVVAGWPLVGVLLGFLLQEGTAWRQVPQRRRVYVQATWLWAAMFALRFAVELPLYLQRHVVELGALSVPLGLPLYGLVLLGTWALVRRVPKVTQLPADPEPAGLPAGRPTAD